MAKWFGLPSLIVVLRDRHHLGKRPELMVYCRLKPRTLNSMHYHSSSSFGYGCDLGLISAFSQGINETNTSPGRSMVLQLSTGNASASKLLASMGNSPRDAAVMTRSPNIGGSCNGGDGGMLPLPLSLGQGEKSGDMDEHQSRKDIDAFKLANNARDSNLGGLFPSFAGSSRGVRQTGENFHSQIGQVTMQGYGGMPQPQHQNPPPTGVGVAPPA